MCVLVIKLFFLQLRFYYYSEVEFRKKANGEKENRGEASTMSSSRNGLAAIHPSYISLTKAFILRFGLVTLRSRCSIRAVNLWFWAKKVALSISAFALLTKNCSYRGSLFKIVLNVSRAAFMHPLSSD